MTEEAKSPPTIPISVGELFDRLSILTIKLDKIGSKEVVRELQIISEIAEDYPCGYRFLPELNHVNQRLWNIGDRLRLKERRKQFDEEFIQLSRDWVYLVADTRHAIKRKIDESCGSDLSEQKKYASY